MTNDTPTITQIMTEITRLKTVVAKVATQFDVPGIDALTQGLSQLSHDEPNVNVSLPDKFINDCLNKNGESNFYTRDFDHSEYPTLPVYAQYSSGDGIFRSDGVLGKKLNYCRFPRIFPKDLTALKDCLSL